MLMVLIPIDRKPNPGTGALRCQGEIGVERRRRPMVGTQLHALGGIKELDLVAPAYHHRMLRCPFTILVMGEGGILVRGTGQDRLTDEEDQHGRDLDAHG
jgi:hypothetical protein